MLRFKAVTGGKIKVIRNWKWRT